MSRPGKRPASGNKPVPWRTLGVILAVGVVGNLLVWFWPREQDSAATYPTYAEAVVAQGEEIFRMNCVSCHGQNGQGDAGAGVPALNGSMHAWHHPDSQITGFLRNGVGKMPAVGALWSDDEIMAVLAYIKQWWEADQRTYQAQSSRMNP